MRDHVLLYVNGRRFEIRGAAAFASLTDFLRSDRQLTGTKVVCAEGDCGACTVLVGEPDGDGLRYLTVDACIQFLYQLDGRHIVTVEGLRPSVQTPTDDRRCGLHPIQKAMVDCHGSQCGYCTPGFVMALAGRAELQAAQRTDLRTSLTGNLCRCTGYVDILDAAKQLESIDVPALATFYPPAAIARDLRETTKTPLRIETPAARFFAPHTLEQAVEFKAQNPGAAIVSGGTELGVVRNKLGLEPSVLLSLTRVPGLDEISTSNGTISIGANGTWTKIEDWSKEAMPELHRIVVRFGSPQIRNVATLVGNVAHGSPIADSLPFLLVMDAEIDLASPKGTRSVKIADFYKGYKIKDLAADELITHVRIPAPSGDDLLKLYKISRRNDLDIATFGAALRVRRAGDIITRAYVAYSGVAATVVRLPRTEAFLQGKLFTEETFAQAGKIARGEVEPISDVRGSRDFRWTLAENIVSKFYVDCVETYAEVLP